MATVTSNPTIRFGPSLCNIECGTCGHSADFETFTGTPISGDLPRGQYQCPKCTAAWRIERHGKAKIGWSGMIIPPDLVQVPCEARL